MHRLEKINLKGTKIVESGVKDLLGTFGGQLEGFKIDNVTFDVRVTLSVFTLNHRANRL